jgi:hypothetical protein
MFSENNIIEKKKMSLEEAKEFVFGSSFEIKDEDLILTSCIDGRYDEESARNAPRSFCGSDPGFLVLVLGALKKLNAINEKLRKRAFDAVLDVLGGAEIFKMHTDDHNLENGIIAGCGHMKLVKKDPERYLVSKEDVGAVFDYLNFLKNQGVGEIVLAGPHNESAIFVIKDRRIGLLHQNKNLQAFVFHKALYEEFIRDLAQRLLNLDEIKSQGISFENLFKLLKETGEYQLAQTVNQLAQGLPIYEIKLEEGEIKIAEENEE